MHIVTNSKQFTSTTPTLTKLHWLPVVQRSIFKTATLVYKFLTYGYPKYFSTFLSPYHGAYNTRRGRPDRNFLVVPQFRPTVHKSKRHFSHSFAYDAPKVWNDLPDEIRSAQSLASFRKNSRHTYSPKPIHHNIFSVSSWRLRGVDPCYVPRL